MKQLHALLSGKRRCLLATLMLLIVLTSGCSTYSNKFRTVVSKIKQDELFQSLDAKVRYKIEGGNSEAIPYQATLYLEYVDSDSQERTVYRCRYNYLQTWKEGEERDWNWSLAVVHHQLPSGEWVKSMELLDQPKFLEMLRP